MSQHCDTTDTGYHTLSMQQALIIAICTAVAKYSDRFVLLKINYCDNWEGGHREREEREEETVEKSEGISVLMVFVQFIRL